MGKYRGSDGWLHDDTSGPGRYHHKDNTSGPPSRKPPKECPNCGFKSSWRAMEQSCTHCGWGKEPKSKEERAEDTRVAVACLTFLGLAFASFLALTGAGWAIWGFGGALMGAGLTVAGVVCVCALALVVASKGPGEHSDKDG